MRSPSSLRSFKCLFQKASHHSMISWFSDASGPRVRRSRTRIVIDASLLPAGIRTSLTLESRSSTLSHASSNPVAHHSIGPGSLPRACSSSLMHVSSGLSTEAGLRASFIPHACCIVFCLFVTSLCSMRPFFVSSSSISFVCLSSSFASSSLCHPPLLLPSETPLTSSPVSLPP